MKKILCILALFSILGCESKKEIETRKKIENYNKKLVELYENNKLQEALDVIAEFQEEYANLEHSKEVEDINKIIDKIFIKFEEEKEQKNETVKQAVSKLMDLFDKEYDEFQDITWLHSKNLSPNIDVYAGFKGKTYSTPMFYRLVVKYSGDKWIFFKKMTILTDSEKYEIEFNEIERKMDNDAYYVYEKYDIFLDENYEDMIRDMAISKNTKIRLEGTEKVYDFELSDIEVLNLINMLLLIEEDKKLDMI